MKRPDWHGLMMCAAILATLPATAKAAMPRGIGVLGDSYSDEYLQYPPDRSTARNWVEILAETRGLNFGRYSTTGWGEPRNRGYEFNWARSDATTEDMIRTGQHTGLAAQVARGEVEIVYVFIGGNDFIYAFHAADPEAALKATLPRAMANYRTAISTILAAHPRVKLVLGTLPDIRDLPEIAAMLRDGRATPTVAERFSAAMGRYNAMIREIAASDSRIALLDLDMLARLANLFSTERVVLLGRCLDRTRPSNQPDHLFLADARHIGTLGQAHLAKLFVESIDQKFGFGIEPLSDEELLRHAASISTPPREMTRAAMMKP